MPLRPDPPRNKWPALGQPRLPTPHFSWQGSGQPGPQPLTFTDRAQAGLALNPSLPLASSWPSPHDQVMSILGHPRKSFCGLRLRLAPVCRYKIDTVSNVCPQSLRWQRCLSSKLTSHAERRGEMATKCCSTHARTMDQTGQSLELENEGQRGHNTSIMIWWWTI